MFGLYGLKNWNSLDSVPNSIFNLTHLITYQNLATFYNRISFLDDHLTSGSNLWLLLLRKNRFQSIVSLIFVIFIASWFDQFRKQLPLCTVSLRRIQFAWPHLRRFLKEESTNQFTESFSFANHFSFYVNQSRGLETRGLFFHTLY